MTYAGIANDLCDRIVALIPDHPEIMDMTSAWDLHGVEGFDCSDLRPSLFQATWARGVKGAPVPTGSLKTPPVL